MSLVLSVHRLCLGVALGVAAAGCAEKDPAAQDAPASEARDAGLAVEADAAVSDAALPPAPASPAGCRSDDDCQLVNDCCTCQAIPRGEKPTSCDPKRSCVTAVCAQYQGVDRAHCSAGRCVLGFECDPARVLCKRLAPICPPGEVPQIVNGCYGECVDARQCSTVASCVTCAPADACVGGPALPGLHCQSPLVSREM
jgi:hypothetical protein